MTKLELLFDADDLVRPWVQRVVDVAISLMWQVPYAEGDHLI